MNFVVSRVLADIPEHSHLKFDFLQPMSYLAQTYADLKTNRWDAFNFYTYEAVDENAIISPGGRMFWRTGSKVFKQWQNFYRYEFDSVKSVLEQTP